MKKKKPLVSAAIRRPGEPQLFCRCYSSLLDLVHAEFGFDMARAILVPLPAFAFADALVI